MQMQTRRSHWHAAVRYYTDTPRAKKQGQTQLYGTVAHSIFVSKYFESAGIITEHQAWK